MTAKKAKLEKRIEQGAERHPWWSLSTLVSIAAVLTTLAGVVGWVVAHIVLRTDFLAHVEHDKVGSYWADVTAANSRVERLGDNVDLLVSKRLVHGKLDRDDEAALALFQKKLDVASRQWADAQHIAKEAGKER